MFQLTEMHKKGRYVGGGGGAPYIYIYIYLGMMEKKMETTIINYKLRYSGGILGFYGGYI